MLPLRSSSATCVVCLDVLENIEHIYSLFSELCRISSQSVIISLPNPYRSVFNLVAHGPYSSSVNLKFYNLPANKPPEDRHRWFYSPAEAKSFVKMQAHINDFHSTLLFEEGNNCYGKLPLKHQALKFIDSVLFGRRLTNLGFMSGRMWFLLTRNKTK
jgi:ubiquinone/menaquinone biosynthesis C-methylase UbiE